MISSVVIHQSIVALCYLFAFSSLHVQWDALLGVDGLLPVESFTQRVAQHYGFHKMGSWDIMNRIGSLVFLSEKIGVTAEALCQALLVGGMALSLMLILFTVICHSRSKEGSVLMSVGFAAVWLMYHSLVVVGQTFLSFQWDSLLGEVGFCCIFSTLAPQFVPNKLTFRFLAFKLMFMSGLTKVQASCPTWSELTALEYHFATQPLPTPLAWFAHQLPPSLLRLSVLLTLVIEIPLALLLVAPVRSMRRFGVVLQLLLQVVIALTGNYTFFNLLTSSLMLVCWSSDEEEEEEEDSASTAGAGYWWGKGRKAVDRTGLAVAAALTSVSVHYFSSNSHSNSGHGGDDNDDTTVSAWWTGARLRSGVTYAHLEPFVAPCLGGVLLVCGICIVLALIRQAIVFIKCSSSSSSSSSSSRSSRGLFSVLVHVLCAVATTCIIWLSCTTFPSLTHRVQSDLPASMLPPILFHAAQKLAPYRLVSSYGLFRRMTGMAEERLDQKQLSLLPGGYVPALVARPEIVLEGLTHSQQWVEIEFKYKPGSPHRAPRWVAPHQPRLDWQMWFAALSPYQNNPFLVHLVYKLLLPKESRDSIGEKAMGGVWSLLHPGSANFWAEAPPLAIRCVLYHYDFTRADLPWSRAAASLSERVSILSSSSSSSGDGKNGDTSTTSSSNSRSNSSGSPWWHRVHKGLYLDALDLGNESVENFLRGHGVLSTGTGTGTGSNRSPRQLYEACINAAGPLASPWGLGAVQTLVCNAVWVREYLAPHNLPSAGEL